MRIILHKLNKLTLNIQTILIYWRNNYLTNYTKYMKYYLLFNEMKLRIINQSETSK